MLVRSWNLFHGNTKPPQRRAFLDEMVQLATADNPDVLCLQEVPAWAVGRFTVADVAARPVLGPLPIPRSARSSLTKPHHGILRSAFSGQANAIQVAPQLRVLSRHVLTLNSRRFRRAQARALALDPLARLAWSKERRIVQGVRLAAPDGRTFFIANTHCTSYPPDQRLADAELLRVAWFAVSLAKPEDVVVLAGDFNVAFVRSRDAARSDEPGMGLLAGGAWNRPRARAGRPLDARSTAGRTITARSATPCCRTTLRSRWRSNDLARGARTFSGAPAARVSERGHVRAAFARDVVRDRRPASVGSGQRPQRRARTSTRCSSDASVCERCSLARSRCRSLTWLLRARPPRPCTSSHGPGARAGGRGRDDGCGALRADRPARRERCAAADRSRARRARRRRLRPDPRGGDAAHADDRDERRVVDRRQGVSLAGAARGDERAGARGRGAVRGRARRRRSRRRTTTRSARRNGSAARTRPARSTSETWIRSRHGSSRTRRRPTTTSQPARGSRSRARRGSTRASSRRRRLPGSRPRSRVCLRGVSSGRASLRSVAGSCSPARATTS